MDLKQVQAVQAASTEGLEEGPELWAVNAVASPLVERLKLHFAPGRPTSRLDKPEWLLNTVLQVRMTLYVTRVQGSALSLAVGPLNLESIPDKTKGTRQGARGGWGVPAQHPAYCGVSWTQGVAESQGAACRSDVTVADRVQLGSACAAGCMLRMSTRNRRDKQANNA